MLPRLTVRSWMLVLCALAIASPVEADDADDFFEQHVRPLFVAKCLECHGDDEPEGGLRLTSRAHLLKGGRTGPAVQARQPAESLLIQAILQGGKLKMPPDEKLADAEIAALTKWVELGLPWPDTDGVIGRPHKDFAITDADRQHWSFRPVADPPIPKVRHSEWPRNSIDHFVLSKLEGHGLPPPAAADRRTLIRRAYFDLIGLPPTWDEVQAFVSSAGPTDAVFKEIVDRLLASPRYGERWGRHWLDVARFADTKDGVLMYGDERIRPFAYSYRDYVIRAFNEDTPFDRFVQEQLAADAIEPKVEPWRRAAMGFLTLGRMFDNNVHDVIDDQIDTVSRGLLGLTVACSRCHDHKYDPISTADYYSLYGVFASSETPLELPLAASPNSPESVEFEKQYTEKLAKLREFRDEQFALLTETARERIGDYLVHVATTKPDPLETAIFFLSLAPEDLRPPIIARWRRWVDQPNLAADPVFGPWHDLFQGGVPVGTLDPDAVVAAKQRWEARPAGIQSGQLNPLVRETLAKASLGSGAEVARAYGDLLTRVYKEWKSNPAASGTASAPMPDAATQQLLDLLTGRDSPSYFPKSQTRRYMSRQQTDQYGGMLKELDLMAVKAASATPRAMILQDAETPYDPRIFVRGNPTQLGRRVPRQFLEIVAGPARQPFGSGSGRLDLARAITDPHNPLTARVMVNRVWMHHFGEPLVASPSDFGKRSPPPVHGELLDHLATQFVQGGWSLKNLHRLILRSATWQQASPEAESLDASVRIAPRRQRLSFEAMRDSLLALSGRLEHRQGGRPMDISDPQSRCRTVYGLVDRQSLPNMFRAFDFATPDVSVERRPRTMVPQQTLFALNSPFAIEQAKALAARPEVASAADPAERVSVMFRLVFQRDPTDDEQTACQEFVAAPNISAPSDTAPSNAAASNTAANNTVSTLSRWEQLAQVLLSSNELMYVD